MTFLLRRARARGALLGVMLVLSAFITGAIGGTLLFLDLGSANAIRESMEQRTASERTLTFQTRLTPDEPEAQNTVFTDVVGRSVQPQPAVSHSIATSPQTLAGDTDAQIVALTDDLSDSAELTEGSWPTGPDEGALHAQAAQALGVNVGADVQIVVGDTTHTISVTGLWLPDDATDSRWGEDPLIASGIDPADPTVHGPLLVTLETMLTLQADPFARWTVSTPPQFEPSDVPAWVTAVAGWESDLRESDLVNRGLTQSGSIATTLQETQSALTAVRAAAMIPLVLLGILCAVAVWQLARLLVQLRAQETQVLASRGATRKQLLALAIGESVLITIPAVLVATLVLWLVGRGQQGFDSTSLALTAAILAVAGFAVLLIVGALAVRRPMESPDLSGRATAALASGAVVLVGCGAAFTLWRLRRSGGAFLPGGREIDLLAVIAPALTVLAAAALMCLIAAPVSRLVAGLSARSTGLSPALEARYASRNVAMNAVPIMLIVFATATTTLSSAYIGTSDEARSVSAQVENGSDVRVDLGARTVDSTPRGARAYGELTEAISSTGVLQAGFRGEEHAGQITAATPEAWATSTAPDEVLNTITGAPLQIPGAMQGPLLGSQTQTGSVEVEISSEPISQSVGQDVTVQLWLFNGSELIVQEAGAVRLAGNIRFGDAEPEVDPDAVQTVTEQMNFEVPPGDWTLVGVDFLMTAELQAIRYTLSVLSLHSDDQDVTADLEAWTPVQLQPRSGFDTVELREPLLVDALVQLPDDVDAGTAMVRLLPPVPDGPLPVLSTGSITPVLPADGARILVGPTEILVGSVGSLDAVPANPQAAGIVADLPSLYDRMLRSTRTVPSISEVWIRTDDPAAAAQAAAELGGARSAVHIADDGSPDPLSGPARLVYWIAAACAIALALPGVIAVARSQLGSRRGEVVVLRAAGATARQQGRSRRRELLGVFAGAMVGGLVVGVALSALVIVDLAASTTPGVSEAIRPGITFHLLGAVTGLGVIAATLAIIGQAYGRAVTRQARDTTWRQEVR